MHDRLRECGKPTVARVNGIAVGGGNELQMACDLAVMADDAFIRHVGLDHGSVPAGGATQWLPLMVGDRRAREIVMLGEEIPAPLAAEWGLVNRAVPAAELDAVVDDWVAKLAAKLPQTTRYAKQQLNWWRDISWHETVATQRLARALDARRRGERGGEPIPEEALVLVERDGPVGVVLINRPQQLNALSGELMDALVSALQELEADEALRCIVLGGGERAFAAGADIAQLARTSPVELMVSSRLERWDAIRAVRTPIVAAVSGFCLGGGCELAMLCDLIVASETRGSASPRPASGSSPARAARSGSRAPSARRSRWT